MRKPENIPLLFLCSLAGCMFTGCDPPLNKVESTALETRMDTISYIIGLDYGSGIREEQIDVNRAAVYRGLADGLAGKSVLNDSVKESLIDEFNELLKERIEKEGKRQLEKNKMEGQKFLEENVDLEGVVELQSGLQYKILKEGEGAQPKAADSVLIHYRGMFINGDVFDMSYDRGPAGIRINTTIAGLSEALQIMKEGAIYELYIPSGLAYGDVPFANVIPPGSTLIYTIELIEIIKE
jgi:FKBP-type peptidyl-prolyl cis-trans isomerase